MGNQCFQKPASAKREESSGQDGSVTPQLPLVKKIDIQQDRTVRNSTIVTKFLLRRLQFYMINEASFALNQAKDLAKGLINGIITLLQPDLEEQRKEIKALFNQINIRKIANGQQNYFGMLDKLNNPIISKISKVKIYQSQLQQAVKSIADKARHIGQKLNIKQQSIKKQSEKMIYLLLVECIQKLSELVKDTCYGRCVFQIGLKKFQSGYQQKDQN